MTAAHAGVVTFASDDESEEDDVMLKPSSSSNRIYSSRSHVDSPIETEISRVSDTDDQVSRLTWGQAK